MIVADYLGMHISTTTHWVNYIRKDWAAYVAARVEDTGDRKGAQQRSATWVRTPEG
ncbi:hypothetical protein [Streptomyces sp. NBC_00996]|uniref:hypothetical protein n=1 Tax=Streptomyces sp. NBC_00996 TaxID=2903710 RepID=UPI00386DDF75|nr:hypothetical protein OG390_20140 [Streptomyces sp. NBC_00996]